MSIAATRRRLPVLPRLNDESVAAAVHEVVSKMLAERTPALEVAAQAFDLYEQAVAQVEAKLPPPKARACATGCAYCCHLKVAVTPIEALRIAKLLSTKLDAGARSRLSRKVKETDAKTRGMESDARADARIPCPLLGDDARCIAYEARPMACAGANSFDAGQCRAAFESPTNEDMTIENYAPQRRAAGAARAGVSAALFEHRLDGRVLELVAALRVTLSDPDAKAKWEKGLPVFDSALDEEFARLVRPRS